MRTMKGPYLASSRKEGHRIHSVMRNLAGDIPWHINQDSGRTNLKEYEDHVLAIKGIYFAISRKGGYRIHQAI